MASARRFDIMLSPSHLFFPDNQTTPWLRLNIAYLQDPRAKAFIAANSDQGNTPK